MLAIDTSFRSRGVVERIVGRQPDRGQVSLTTGSTGAGGASVLSDTCVSGTGERMDLGYTVSVFAPAD